MSHIISRLLYNDSILKKIVIKAIGHDRIIGFFGFILFCYLISRQKTFTKARFYAKCILLIFCGMMSASIGILVSPLTALIGKRSSINFIVARSMAFLSQHLINLKYVVQGKENLIKPDGKPIIYLANHQDALDIIAMGVIIPENVVVLAKKSIKYIPFLGWFMLLANNIFIDRKNKQSALETMGKVADELNEKGLGVWIYPEGTRSGQNDRSLLPFKKGAFFMAIEGKVPIVPIVISTYSPLYDTKIKDFHDGIVTIKVLPEINTDGMKIEDVNKLIEHTRNSMLIALQELESVPTDLGYKEIDSNKKM